jgi:FMN phosphatase YigB (HAD superfamily)
MDKKYLLLDADDTIIDWLSHFKQFILAKNVPLKGKDLLEWDLSSWLDIPKNDISKLIHEFNCSEHFKSIPAFKDAKKVLKKLSKSHRIIVITSCSTDMMIQENRAINLKSQFGNIFEKIHCLDYGVSKKEVLSMYPNSVFIDDKMENLVAALEVGHIPLIIHRAFNSKASHPKIKRMMDWFEIDAFLKTKAVSK